MNKSIFKIKETHHYESIGEQVEREKDRFFWMMQGLH